MGLKNLFGKKDKGVDLKTLKMGKDKDEDLEVSVSLDSKFDPATSWDDISAGDYDDEQATTVYNFDENSNNNIDLKTKDLYSEKNYENTLNDLYKEDGINVEKNGSGKDFDLKDLYKENGVDYEEISDVKIKEEITKDIEEQFGNDFVSYDEIGQNEEKIKSFNDNFSFFKESGNDSASIINDGFEDANEEKKLMEIYENEDEKDFSSSDLLVKEKNVPTEKTSSDSNQIYYEVENVSKLKKVVAAIGGIFGKKDGFDRKSLEFGDLDETKTSEFGEQDFIYQEKFVPKKLPLFSYLEVKTQYKLIISTFVFGAILTGGSLIMAQIGETREGTAALTTSRIWGDNLGYSQIFSKVAQTGDSEKLGLLKKSYEKMLKDKKDLTNQFISLGNKGFIEEDKRVNKVFDGLTSNVETLVKLSETAKSLDLKRKNLDKGVEEISNLVDRLIIVSSQVGANQSEIGAVFQLRATIQNIQSNMSSIINDENLNPHVVAKLQASKRDIKDALTDLLNGSEAKGVKALEGAAVIQAYKRLVASWLELSKGVDEILSSQEEIVALKNVLVKNISDVAKLNDELSNINAKFNYKNYAFYDLIVVASFVGMLIMLIAGIALLFLYTFEKDNKSEEDRIENNKNRTAILQLLNEMLPLQDGDLRRPVTVTEEVTGAIAESVNATIESLAGIVQKIKDTTLIMREKSSEMSLISLEMLNSTEEQAASITNTGSSVIGITDAINNISVKTKRTAQIAEESAKSSKVGETQVTASLQSMQSINKNMEETVLLMKKVGDSSKQISEIVELLSDISEETNILALNATVQAAKAGEAGKGFKIVAESIQELADTASDATRRVGALISAVQTDIQSVSLAVDKTKEEVISGVALSEEAGRTLGEVSQISFNLAETVKEISEEANKNAIIAKGVSRNMEKILEVTEKTKESTEKTTESITEIAGMSSELGESVQKFQL